MKNRQRTGGPVRTALGVAAVLLLSAVSGGAASLLIVDVKTNYLPYEEFDFFISVDRPLAQHAQMVSFHEEELRCSAERDLRSVGEVKALRVPVGVVEVDRPGRG
jgi:hypothetical protein